MPADWLPMPSHETAQNTQYHPDIDQALTQLSTSQVGQWQQSVLYYLFGTGYLPTKQKPIRD